MMFPDYAITLIFTQARHSGEGVPEETIMNLFLLNQNMRQRHPVLRQTVEYHHQRAAVLVLLYPRRGRTHVLMIKRSFDLKIHPGEIAFPGGLLEEEDTDLMDTALRETAEELNLEIPEDRVVGRLEDVTTLTGFEVTPFVAQIDIQPVFEKYPAEVEEVLQVPLAPLLATQGRDVGYKLTDEMYVFWHGPERIWGATARILHQISQLSTHRSG